MRSGGAARHRVHPLPVHARTLTFLQRGGRIGNAAALLGNLIQLSPVLTVSDGKADTFAKVRTRKKALDRIVTEFKKDVEQHGLKHVVVHYIGDKAPAVAWARESSSLSSGAR